MERGRVGRVPLVGRDLVSGALGAVCFTWARQSPTSVIEEAAPQATMACRIRIASSAHVRFVARLEEGGAHNSLYKTITTIRGCGYGEN